MELLNIFNSGGLWAVAFIVIIIGLCLIYKAYTLTKGGSYVGGSSSDPTNRHEDKNVSITNPWQFKFGVALVILGIGMLIWIGSDYKGV